MSPGASAPRPSRWRPALLSGIVFPGLGQLASGHPLRGLAFGGATVVALVVLVRRVARETLARMPDDPTAIDPLFPFRLAHEIQRDNGTFFFWITVVILAVWAGSILDAWMSSRPPDRSTRPGS